MNWKILVLSMMATLLVANATKSEVEAFFNETANLPCGFKNPQNISQEELVIFWQGAKDDVLYELYRGREKQIHVHPNYINRTKFNQTTWILHLLNVQIMDQGKCTCFVQHLGPKGLVIIHQLSFQLSVLAPFSQPKITRLDNKTAEIGEILNFSCSSKQGYPKPEKIYWIVETTNSTKYPGEIHLSQDDTNQLYYVTTALSLPITESTIWINITCFLKTQGPVELLTSETLQIKMKPHEELDRNFVIPGVIVVLVLTVVLLIILRALPLKKCSHLCDKKDENMRPKEMKDLSSLLVNVSEATRVKTEDTDHPKERDEALEPLNHQMCEKKGDR